MTSTPPSNSYHIARRVDSGARPLVRNQARIEKSATGSKSNSNNVVIAPLNMHALRQISDNNLQNLHLPNSSPVRIVFTYPEHLTCLFMIVFTNLEHLTYLLLIVLTNLDYLICLLILADLISHITIRQSKFVIYVNVPSKGNVA